MEGIVIDPRKAANDSWIINLITQCGQLLEKMYPPPEPDTLWWAIEVPDSPDNAFKKQHGDVIIVRNIALAPEMGYPVYQDLLISPEERRNWMTHVGGEILERHGLPRGKVPMNQFLELRRRINGSTIHDTSK